MTNGTPMTAAAKVDAASSKKPPLPASKPIEKEKAVESKPSALSLIFAEQDALQKQLLARAEQGPEGHSSTSPDKLKKTDAPPLMTKA